MHGQILFPLDILRQLRYNRITKISDIFPFKEKQKMNSKDREYVRRLAHRKAELANDEKNASILGKWQAQAEGRRETPTVRLLFSNFRHEVVDSRLQCEDELAREIESSLLRATVGRELFDDDTPVSGYYDVKPRLYVHPFGANPDIHRAENGMGFHIQPLTDDIEKDFALFEGGGFSEKVGRTKQYCAEVDEVIGDILPARIIMPSLTGAMTNPLVMLIGMENYYLSMYDCPETLHKIMDMACSVYERYYDFLEREKLLLPTNGFSEVNQETFGFSSELPCDRAERTNDCWGFLESQETTAVSAEMFGEFVYPYQDRLAKRFGLLSYGCCERVDAIFPDYLSKWKNLRKLSVSPFNNEALVGEYLRGTNIVYYSKPRAEYVTNPGPLNEDGIRKYFEGVAKSASGCLFEVAQREVGTIYSDYERGRRYVELAKETIDKYWKP